MLKKSCSLMLVTALCTITLLGCGSTPAPTPTPTPAPAPQLQTASGGDGKSLYESNCAGCHGNGGVGGGGGPALNNGKWSDPQKVAEITTKGKGGMPAYQGKLKDDEIQAIAKYVASLKK